MGSGKRLNDIEKGQIKAIKDVNLSISDIFMRVNRSRKVIRRYLNDPESYGKKLVQEDLKNFLNMRSELPSAKYPRGLAQQET